MQLNFKFVVSSLSSLHGSKYLDGSVLRMDAVSCDCFAELDDGHWLSTRPCTLTSSTVALFVYVETRGNKLKSTLVDRCDSMFGTSRRSARSQVAREPITRSSRLALRNSAACNETLAITFPFLNHLAHSADIVFSTPASRYLSM